MKLSFKRGYWPRICYCTYRLVDLVPRALFEGPLFCEARHEDRCQGAVSSASMGFSGISTDGLLVAASQYQRPPKEDSLQVGSLP